MRPLIADGGQVTFLRDLAAYSWGKWAVEWPETVPEDQRPKPTKDDRDFGYVAKLGRNLGRMGRRFTRSDVSITAAEYTAEGKPIQYSGFSDVEDVLDAAQKRVGSDVFIERDITRAGLNGNVPYIDFDIDDVVPVLIWGKTLDLPVTSIQEVTQEGAVIDWQIHVGGELISNDLARERANQDIERAIAQERRERQDAVSTVDSKASSAVSTANSADGKADKALKAATDANGVIESKLADHRRLVAEFDTDVAVNRRAADDMARAAEAYASAVDSAKADTERYSSLVKAAKVDTDRYAALVANSKAIQSAVESAAADAKRASNDVSNLINAPDGEFRKGVAKFTEFQTMVNDKQSAWNVGIQKTLDAQADVNTKQQQINAVQADVNRKQQLVNAAQADVNTKQQLVNELQQEVNATQSNINRQQGEINTALSNATKAASNAATDAKTAADAAKKTAADAVSTANLVAEQQAAYKALSEERNDLQDSNIIMLADLQKEQLRALGDVFIIGGNTNVGLATVSNAYFSKNRSSDYLTALGSWTGRIIFTSYGRSSATDVKETGMYEAPVPLPDGSRQINLKNYTPAKTTTATDWMQVQYWVDPAVQYRSEKTDRSFTATQNAWTTIGTHTISRSKQQDNFVGSWRVFWGAANLGSTYGIRIVTSSGTVLKEKTTTKLGPLTSLGIGSWSMYTQVSGVDIPAGQSVYFQVYCSHSGMSQRGIYKSESSASWLEEN